MSASIRTGVGRGKLNTHERAALVACEAIVQENLGAWVNVSNALGEIARNHLYREGFPTFEAYLRDRWGLSRSQGHRLVLAGRVAMSPVGDRIRNERQARELAVLLDDPKMLVAVVDRAENLRLGKAITAAAIRQARTELLLPPEEARTARKVYEAAEWTAEAWQAWQNDTQAQVVKMTTKLPPSSWGWSRNALAEWDVAHGRHEQIAQRSEAEHLRGIVRLVAFDAPLTPEVVAFLRAAPLDEPVVNVFAEIVGSFQNMADGAREMQTGEVPSLSELGHLLEGAAVAIVQEVSRRMSDVVLAMSEPSEVQLRTWTPEEEAEAREQFAALIKSVRDWKPGPLGDGVRGAMSSFEQVADKLRKTLDGAETRSRGREEG